MGAQVHGGRSQGSAIVFHTRPAEGSQPSPGGEVNAYAVNTLNGYRSINIFSPLEVIDYDDS
jgi:hypothetical protein